MQDLEYCAKTIAQELKQGCQGQVENADYAYVFDKAREEGTLTF